VNFNDSKWETVTVPHDWAIYGPFDKMWINRAIVQNGENIATEKTEDGRTS
jgi:beta-galactosidase